MADLRTGDSVLVRVGTRAVYEPVLSFLHVIRGTRVDHMAVHHSLGVLRASRGHLILTTDGDKTVADLRPGDGLVVAKNEDFVVSPVLAVVSAPGLDAYAPLTASGRIIVDSVVASVYASPSTYRISHNVMHSFLFPVRTFHHVFGPTTFGALEDSTSWKKNVLHPFLELTYRRLRVDAIIFTGEK